MSGNENESAREIGVRAALGASRRDILALVLREGLLLAAAGMALGLAGASVARLALKTLIFEVPRLDLPTYASVLGVLGLVAVSACATPAWRASRVDPSITLRSE